MTANNSDEVIVVTGTIEFYWDSGDDERHLLINIEPSQQGVPDAYELTGDLRDQIIDDVTEGATIEIKYRVEHHEIVDPDSATTVDSHRAAIESVRMVRS